VAVSTKSKAKGTTAEREVVRYLQNWWPAAERRALSGNKDKGDVAGIPGVVVEVKAAKAQQLAAWKRETLTEQDNAGATRCMLVVKRPYKAVQQWDAYIPVPQLPDHLWWYTPSPEEEGYAEWVRMDLALATALLRSHLLPSSLITA
jgi:Holliday junction resolvase